MLLFARIDLGYAVQRLEAALGEDAHCVVDTGASSFFAVSHYLIENEVHEQIRPQHLLNSLERCMNHKRVAGD